MGTYIGLLLPWDLIYILYLLILSQSGTLRHFWSPFLLALRPIRSGCPLLLETDFLNMFAVGSDSKIQGIIVLFYLLTSKSCSLEYHRASLQERQKSWAECRVCWCAGAGGIVSKLPSEEEKELIVHNWQERRIYGSGSETRFWESLQEFFLISLRLWIFYSYPYYLDLSERLLALDKRLMLL